jgi:hypothetical protein
MQDEAAILVIFGRLERVARKGFLRWISRKARTPGRSVAITLMIMDGHPVKDIRLTK